MIKNDHFINKIALIILNLLLIGCLQCSYAIVESYIRVNDDGKRGIFIDEFAQVDQVMAEELASILKRNEIAELHIKFKYSFSPGILQIIFNVLQENRSLTALTVEGVGIEAENSDSDENAIFAVRQSALRSDEVRALSEFLLKNSSLTTLNLMGTNIGTNGVRILTEGLLGNATLTTLNLGMNGIDAEGAEVLANFLIKNNTLTLFNIGSNCIQNKGAQALAGALQANRTLRILNLSMNGIGVQGARALSKALKDNKSIYHINLFDNPIKRHGFAAFIEALRENNTIRSVIIGKNRMGFEGKLALIDFFSTNMEIIVQLEGEDDEVLQNMLDPVLNEAMSMASESFYEFMHKIQERNSLIANPKISRLLMGEFMRETDFTLRLGRHPRLGANSLLSTLDRPTFDTILNHLYTYRHYLDMLQNFLQTTTPEQLAGFRFTVKVHDTIANLMQLQRGIIETRDYTRNGIESIIGRISEEFLRRSISSKPQPINIAVTSEDSLGISGVHIAGSTNSTDSTSKTLTKDDVAKKTYEQPSKNDTSSCEEKTTRVESSAAAGGAAPVGRIGQGGDFYQLLKGKFIGQRF